MDENPMAWADFYRQFGLAATAMGMLCTTVWWLGKKLIASLEANATSWQEESKINSSTLCKIEESTAAQARCVEAIQATTAKIQATLDRHTEHIGEVRQQMPAAKCRHPGQS